MFLSKVLRESIKIRYAIAKENNPIIILVMEEGSLFLLAKMSYILIRIGPSTR